MKLGLDCSTKGYFVLLENNRIIDICKVPQKQKIYKDEIKILNKEIKLLEPQLLIRGNKKKIGDVIDSLKRQIKCLDDNSPLDSNRCLEWLSSQGKIDVVNIEKKIMQTANPTTIQSLSKMSEYIGVCRTLLELNNIPLNFISIQDWRSNFEYRKLPESFVIEYRELNKHKKNVPTKSEISREWVKQESIRLAKKHVINIEDFWIPERSKNISDDICESALLGLL